MKKKVELVCADCKVYDIMDAVQTALKGFGVHLTPSPGAEGSDSLAFYLSNYKIGAKELKALDKEYEVSPYEEDED